MKLKAEDQAVSFKHELDCANLQIEALELEVEELRSNKRQKK